MSKPLAPISPEAQEEIEKIREQIAQANKNLDDLRVRRPSLGPKYNAMRDGFAQQLAALSHRLNSLQGGVKKKTSQAATSALPQSSAQQRPAEARSTAFHYMVLERDEDGSVARTLRILFHKQVFGNTESVLYQVDGTAPNSAMMERALQQLIKAGLVKSISSRDSFEKLQVTQEGLELVTSRANDLGINLSSVAKSLTTMHDTPKGAPSKAGKKKTYHETRLPKGFQFTPPAPNQYAVETKAAGTFGNKLLALFHQVEQQVNRKDGVILSERAIAKHLGYKETSVGALYAQLTKDSGNTPLFQRHRGVGIALTDKGRQKLNGQGPQF